MLINDVLVALAEQQKEKIADNFLKELFIIESVLGTAEIRDLLREIKDKPLSDARSEFIRKIGGEMAVKASKIGLKTTTSQQEFNKRWEADKLEMVDGRELLKSFRKWPQDTFNVSFSNQELINEMNEVHPDIVRILNLINESKLL